MEAATRWAQQLTDWAIPDEILEAAPESPWEFDVGLFSRIADQALSADGVSQLRAREALPDDGSVLDVGCGAGAASLPLAPPAVRLIGVDESPDMLAEFARRAAQRALTHEEILGSWPQVATTTPHADVVVCTNVFYNVADLDPFVRALADHASRRVVVELTDRHPLSWMNPYWEELHGLQRPYGPTAEDAAAVAAEAGFTVHTERWERPSTWEHRGEDLVTFVRRRLCLPATRDPGIREVIDRHPPPATRGAVTLCLDTHLG